MQQVKIVIGYLPKIDRLPREPRRLGFIHRLAFVLETYSSYVDAEFDPDVYEGLVHAVRKVVGGERIQVLVGPSESYEISTAEEFHKLVQEVPEAGREPFTRLVVIRGSSPVATVESEPWAHVGGPDPYHDSYTLAVFAGVDVSGVLVEEARMSCKAMGAEIVEIIQGAPSPVKRGIVDMIKDAVEPWRRLIGRKRRAA